MGHKTNSSPGDEPLKGSDTMADRAYTLKVRLNDEEKDKLQKDCTKAKLNQSKYVRMLIMKKEVKTPPDINYFGVMNELKRIGTNLNQIAKAANSGHLDVPCTEEASANLNQFISELTSKVRG